MCCCHHATAGFLFFLARLSGRGEDGLGRAFRNNEDTVIIADDQVSRSDRDARFERCPPTWLA